MYLPEIRRRREPTIGRESDTKKHPWRKDLSRQCIRWRISRDPGLLKSVEVH